MEGLKESIDHCLVRETSTVPTRHYPFFKHPDVQFCIPNATLYQQVLQIVAEADRGCTMRTLMRL